MKFRFLALFLMLALIAVPAVAVALLLQLIQNVPVTLLALVIAPDLILHWRDKRGTAAPDATKARRASDSVERAD